LRLVSLTSFWITVRQWLGIELVEVSLNEKLVAALGGGISILILLMITSWALSHGAAPAVVASMGASAVLLFAVPHGQLLQPWPVIAGHSLSTPVSVQCAQWIASPVWAAASAVRLAIAVMVQCKCIHPAGGAATAFTAVMGGQAVHDLGFGYVLTPALANALVGVLLAVIINHAFHCRRYPASLHHRRPSPVPEPTHEEVIEALRPLDSFVDVSEDDLLQLVQLLRNKR
jgi:CBS domain-containing membrane protein